MKKTCDHGDMMCAQCLEERRPNPPVPYYKCEGCGTPRRALVVRRCPDGVSRELCRRCADQSGTMSPGQEERSRRQAVAEARAGVQRLVAEDPAFMMDPYERMVTGDL